MPNPVGSLAPPDGAPVPADKMFVQDMFPYPSGEGLHVGHPLGYIATDVYARYFRMTGRNVLHALGFDAFGLPAEQYAIQTGTHPRIRTEANIVNFRRQLGRLGFGHDARRSFSTTDVDYYKWTQWIFLQIYNAWFDPAVNKARPIAELIAEFDSGARTLDDGRAWSELSAGERADVIDSYRLVYRADSMVNWCPGLGTVLANEEVTSDGRSERGNFPVFRKRLRQWMMRITAYSDRLLDDLEVLDWPEKVKTMQRNWIGRSTGASVLFGTEHGDIEVFTTRPDTLFGATYMVLAPEHELVDKLTARAVAGRRRPAMDVRGGHAARGRRRLPRRHRRQVRSGAPGEQGQDRRVHRRVRDESGQWSTDSGLHRRLRAARLRHRRDHGGARWRSAGLGLRQRVRPADRGNGCRRRYFAGGVQRRRRGGQLRLPERAERRRRRRRPSPGGSRPTAAGRPASSTSCGTGCSPGSGTGASRSRSCTTPTAVPHPLPESALPVELPDIADYSPVLFDPDDADSEPSPPLGKATDWVHVELDLGDGFKPYTRDTNVMPQWAGSSWYELRYTDPYNKEELCAKENEAYWMGPRPAEHGPKDPGGVDLYVGGVEHAVLHLLYVRFWHKVLYDLGHISSREPFRRLVNQGYIQAFAYTDARGAYVPAAEVEERDGKFYWASPRR